MGMGSEQGLCSLGLSLNHRQPRIPSALSSQSLHTHAESPLLTSPS